MEKEQYGGEYQNHLIEQYKLYVQSTDQISNRRIHTNHFYISLLSGIIVLFSFAIGKDYFFEMRWLSFIVIGLTGLILCILWYYNINSYKQLNGIKFQVIHEIEEKLPFACYNREWEIEQGNYLRFTQIEKYVPCIIGIPYLLLIVSSIYILVK